MSNNTKQLTKDKTELEAYLKSQHWLGEDENILAIEVPGEGNMNLTLRIKTKERSFIIKQSRDYVEKYPQVEAPADRVLREADFYKLTATHTELNNQMPNLLGVDKENHVLNLQDLGQSRDFTFLYNKGEVIADDALEKIITFIAKLHKSLNRETTEENLTNREMRMLNHEHIYIFPYLENNGLNLDDILPGLKEAAKPYKKNAELKRVLQNMGDRYLNDGKTLLHGDYFPGSWLETEDGIKIIDAEFCFFGDTEFELGVTLAHLKMAAQPPAIVEKAMAVYQKYAQIDETLCFKYMAVEILRRILGLAQLPLSLSLEELKKLLAEARNILVEE